MRDAEHGGANTNPNADFKLMLYKSRGHAAVKQISTAKQFCQARFPWGKPFIVQLGTQWIQVIPSFSQKFVVSKFKTWNLERYIS